MKFLKEYDFLDLSDVKEAELSSLQCALYDRKTGAATATRIFGRAESGIDTSSCSSSTAGPPTVSSRLDSLSEGEWDIASHSPERGAGAGHPHTPPPPYVAPPPAYPSSHPHHWPVAAPNVYVSQVTANVNVHGYMGQYYQPRPEYVQPQVDRPRTHRRDRRGKRAPSPPPPQLPPYYVQYPQHYHAAQAQGAPSYHLPKYQPVVYGPYAYPHYCPEYPMPVKGDTGEKGLEEYPREVAMETEAVDAYYASAHCAGPPYGSPVEDGVEYMSPIYLPPLQHPPPVPIPQHPQPLHQSKPHQFNVHAKNFVQGQSQNKNYTSPEKTPEQKTLPVTATVTATTFTAAATVESLPVEDLKISTEGPSSLKQSDQLAENSQKKSVISPSQKVAPAVKTDASKPGSVPNEAKSFETANNQVPAVAKSFPPTASANNNQSSVDPKVPPPTGKPTKDPAAPFSDGKQLAPGKSWASLFTPKPSIASPALAQTTAVTTEEFSSPVPMQKDPASALSVQPSPFSDDPNSYRMGEFLSKYQLDNRPVSLLPRGLTNRSNYCYVNAILQALIACPPFYNMLKALPYQTRRGKSTTPVIDSMVELSYKFSAAAGTVPAGRARRRRKGAVSRGPAAPAGPPLEGGAGLRVLRALRSFPGSQEGGQQDAEEFLSCLLNSLNDEMLELMKLVEPEETNDSHGQQNGVIPQDQAQEEDDDDDDDEWKVMGPRNRGAVERRRAAHRTPVGDIFRGRTRVRLTRGPHHDVTDAVQPFFTLHLDIERVTNVKDALELLANKDTLEGVSDAWQQFSLVQLPVVLLLHLKCYRLDSEGHTAKIVKNIDYPKDLNIHPKIISSKLKYTSKQRVYKLFAVVYHEGVEAVKGHYLTDTYHGQMGWNRFDDAIVSRVSDAQVLKPEPPRMPYLLMYRRHDTLPPHRAASKSDAM